MPVFLFVSITYAYLKDCSPVSKSGCHGYFSMSPFQFFLAYPFTSKTCMFTRNIFVTKIQTNVLRKKIKFAQYSHYYVDFLFSQKQTDNGSIVFTDNQTFGKPPEHIIAQPSKVKVTHVYNQSVWSHVPSTVVQPSVTPTAGHTNQVVFPSTSTSNNYQTPLPQTSLTRVTSTGITTLQQVWICIMV